MGDAPAEPKKVSDTSLAQSAVYKCLHVLGERCER